MRYEVIAWDGCGEFITIEEKLREKAREWKRYLVESTYVSFQMAHRPCWPVVRIWDRKRKEFVR